MEPPIQPDPRILYLLHFLKAAVGYLGFIGILTTAVIAVTPDITNHVAWLQILIILGSVIGFGAITGLVNHIADPNLRAALLAALEAIQGRLSVLERGTIKTPAAGGPNAINLPQKPPEY